ncbi:DUF4041 domain-containing protein [Glaciecola sp. KUL10]|uniref:DUF4041 domain-containing protein n=1 Tax=Glaciecola sp. (strain KUL10) TaxID=2161813 RepID=UPI000D78859B|nr:DUF4041 domain-containing protein [Glaciecola sp. KUL10]GBL03315.1 chromosome segregation ATPase family protein [Glaciecola sp. KUL10]
MPQELDPYQLAALIIAGFSTVLLLSLFSMAKSSRTITIEIERKERALQQKPINQILADLKQIQYNLQQKIDSGNLVFDKVRDSLTQINDKLKYIDVGLLPPTFKLDHSESLKKSIKQCRLAQFKTIKADNATTAHTNWTWMGSKSDGTKMVNAYRRLLLKAFNAEFDVIHKKMRHSSYDAAVNKLERLEEQLDRLGETANVTISHEYFNLKLRELDEWHSELEHKEELKQEKKTQQAMLRAQARQSGGKDTEELEDDIYYRKSDLKKAQKLAQQMHGASAKDMEMKLAKMQKEIEKLEQKFERATSQAQITKAGYIYVISNIGSFGEGVVKIGMTRRLEPMDRVRELGDASVPFKFDVHTLAFVDDAPKMEKLLHRKFEDRRVNVKNYRKEFFNVPPQEVAKAIEALDIESDWFFDIEAKEYRESLLIRDAIEKSKEKSKAPNAFLLYPSSI